MEVPHCTLRVDRRTLWCYRGGRGYRSRPLSIYNTQAHNHDSTNHFKLTKGLPTPEHHHIENRKDKHKHNDICNKNKTKNWLYDTHLFTDDNQSCCVKDWVHTPNSRFQSKTSHPVSLTISTIKNSDSCLLLGLHLLPIYHISLSSYALQNLTQSLFHPPHRQKNREGKKTPHITYTKVNIYQRKATHWSPQTRAEIKKNGMWTERRFRTKD